MFSVEMYQNESEFATLLDMYRKLKAGKVIEIGSMFGGSLEHWMKYAKRGGKIANIDLVVPKADDRYESQMAGHTKLWQEWAEEYGVKLLSINGSSLDKKNIATALDFVGGSVDFVFIDGDHSFKAVQSDFDSLADKVRDGGIIALHDIHNAGTGVPAYWKALRGSWYNRKPGLMIEILDGGDGIGVVKIDRS